MISNSVILFLLIIIILLLIVLPFVLVCLVKNYATTIVNENPELLEQNKQLQKQIDMLENMLDLKQQINVETTQTAPSIEEQQKTRTRRVSKLGGRQNRGSHDIITSTIENKSQYITPQHSPSLAYTDAGSVTYVDKTTPSKKSDKGILD